jgi:glutamate racemase
MSVADKPIGVFDSGVGGLSVLLGLRAELPHERFVYVADSGHAPYGERDDSHVIARSHAVTRYLREQHEIKTLVVACNTATAAAIKLLRQDHADMPIIGIEPALKPAVASSKTGVVGVMATRSTLQSEKFLALLASLNGKARFVLQACDGLVDAIEREDAIKKEAACSNYTRAMGRFGLSDGEMDTLVLGCTHYPFVEPELRRAIGNTVVLLEGGAPVARQTRRLLGEKDLLAEPGTCDAGSVLFFTTGRADMLANAVRRWLYLEAPVHTLQIA